MRIAVPHNTTRENARRIVEQKLSTLLSHFGHHAEKAEHEWTGDTLRFKGRARGLSLEGSLEVTDEIVIIDGKLPLLAMPFEQKIRQTVEREAAAMFQRA
jgi:hypothetical protein